MSRLSRVRSSTSRKSSRLYASEDNIAPWPEWSDSFINTVQWNPYEVPVTAKTAKTAKSDKPDTSAKGKSGLSTAETKKSIVDEPVEDKCFIDGFSWQTKFAGEEVKNWERAAKVVGSHEEPILVRYPFTKSLDLISNNSHLMDNTYIKDIMETTSCLFVASLNYSFNAEFRGANFNPPNEYWKPWHHVYANIKAGGGDAPMPTYNKFGKYMVRLYFLGKWRRIEVDDFFPLGVNGKLLLPVSCDNDLWFPILSKALLRVITACGEENNVSVITALTGWIKTSISLNGTNSDEAWNLCCSHLLKRNELLPQISEDLHCSYFGGTCLNDSTHLSETKSQKVLVFADVIERIYNLEDVEPEKRELFTYLNRVDQNWIKTSDYPAWKEYRWFDWAYRHNILKGKIGQIFKIIDVYCPIWNAVGKCVEKVPTDLTTEQTESVDYFKQCEFEKFKEYVVELYLYYLPSQFQQNFRTENLAERISNPTENVQPRGKSATPMKPPESNKIKLVETAKGKTQGIASSRYEESSCPSFFIITDSPYCKRIYIDLMFFNSVSDPPGGYFSCEKFYWNQDIPATPIFFAKSRGSVCKVIKAGPGRHAFRIRSLLPDSYFAQIFSNTSFLIDSIETVHDIFQDDSFCYKLYATQISEQFRQFPSVQYGSERHSQILKSYTESFYPTDLRRKSELHQNLIYRIQFDKLLEECILEFLANSEVAGSSEIVSGFIGKMKKYLLNPSFGDEILSSLDPTENFDDRAKNGRKPSAPTSAAKSTAKSAKGTGKQNQLSDEIFFDKIENNVLILKMIMAKENSFLEFYPFCYDDQSKIVVQNYSGKAEIQTHHPFFIASRLIVNIHSESEVPCGIYPFITHDFCRICVYDIETAELVPVKFERNSIWILSRNEAGFIIMALCFNMNSPSQEKIKSFELPWRIRVVGSDENSLLHPCRLQQGEPCIFNPPSSSTLTTEMMRGYYIPNPYNLITKFMIKLTKNDVVTLQLSVSCPTAIISLFLQDKNQVIVKSIEGRGNLLMPAVRLITEDAYEEAGIKYFSGQVFLKYNSWVLSDNDKAFIAAIKETYVPFSDISGSGGKMKKKRSKINLDEESSTPSWTLTIITEQTTRDKITKLLPDTRIFDNFKKNTAQPKSDERLIKGSELRSNFWAYMESINVGEDENDERFGKPLNVPQYYQSLLRKFCGNKI